MKEIFLNTVYNADCMNFMHFIPDGCIDLAVIDPPYGKSKLEWDVPLDLWLLWKHLDRLLKPNSAVIIFTKQPYTSEVVLSNLKFFKEEWIWQKSKSSNFMNAKKSPLRNHENILVFYRRPPTYNPQGLKNVHVNSGRKRKGSTFYGRTGCREKYTQTQGNYPKTVIQFNSEHNPLHPSQKPLKLVEYLIRTYSNKFDTVLDCVSGLGTTALACLNTNRHFLCIERDEEFYELSTKRIKNETLS